MSAAGTDPAATAAPPLEVSQDLVPPFPRSATEQHPTGADHSSIVRRADNDKRPAKQSPQICRFYGTKSGCRAGDACRFQHVLGVPTSKPKQQGSSRPKAESSAPTTSDVGTGTSVANKQQDGKLEVPSTIATRAPFAKPVPQAQKLNPREFQIGQVVRRFKPGREDNSDGTTTLVFSLSPSDPDFAFDLVALQCKLTVPAGWPSTDAKPTIRIQNPEIPRGYQINIERGFATLVLAGKTLLALLNDLDRHLERFLSSEKAATIKIVANRKNVEPIAEPKIAPARLPTPQKLDISRTMWTADQLSAAKEKRQADIQQLEARMGRVALFTVSTDKTIFNIPLQIPKAGRLPVPLQAVKEMTLTVPKLYDLEPCAIKLKGVTGVETDKVEAAFLQHVIDHREMTLMAHINYLTQHLHEMAVSSVVDQTQNFTGESSAEVAEQSSDIESQVETDGFIDEDRPHLVFLSRPPPEWSKKAKADDEEFASDSSLDFESDSESDEGDDDDSSVDGGQDGGASVPANPSASSHLEKGVSLSFPNLEMTGIELLEVHSLSITVKCDRCKSPFEFKNVQPHDQSANTTLVRTESCNKCASSLIVSYSAEPIHANSTKAGFLDLEGCTVQDMSPSIFLPTCSECSTTQSLPGTAAVRGDTALAVCRSCHKKMTFHIHEVKFLRVFQSSGHSKHQSDSMKKKKKKENLSITAGTELPLQGRCKHYSKSYRWFRFSCCQRVYACDRCHDATEPHPNEHANRMICGWCSREQNYRPEDCSACRRSVVRRTRGGGFWEGGKGTRDRVKMNRNDPRKYKRIGGGSTS